MSDLDDDFDFDALKAAVARATPRPDAAARAAHLRLAQENFAALQGARDGARPNPERPGTGIRRGVKDMIGRITGRGALTMTTALVACGVLVLSPAGQSLWRDGWQPGTVEPQEGPVAETVAPAPDTNTSPVVDAPDTVAQPQRQMAETEGRVDAEEAPDMAALETQPATGQDDMALVTPDATAPQGEAGDLAPAAPDTAVVVPTLRQAAPMDGLTMASPGAVIGGALMADEQLYLPEPDTEAFANETENPLRIVAEEPVSTFSIDVDTASWSVMRSKPEHGGSCRPPMQVRIEETDQLLPLRLRRPGPDEEAVLSSNITRHADPVERRYATGQHRHPGRDARRSPTARR
jgi:Ca-activated chloride channel family protein